MSVTHLIDTSAAARILAHEDVRQRWRDHLAHGVIAVCDITELEILYSAQSLANRLRMREHIRDLFNWTLTPDETFIKAHRIQQVLTENGKHRSAGAVDLVLSAIAELSGLTLLHYDRDFETIARLTGMSTAWIAEPGSI